MGTLAFIKSTSNHSSACTAHFATHGHTLTRMFVPPNGTILSFLLGPHFSLVQSTGDCGGCAVMREPPKSVSYTHLTLPTKA